jgi:hypothetical protein
MTQFLQELYIPQNGSLSRQSTDMYEECTSEAENSGSSSDQMIYSDQMVYDAKSSNEYVLNYNARIFKPSSRRTIHFPKSVLTTNVPTIREFKEPQKHLYYYLTWSCKMALVDQGFIHFTFSDYNVADIGIFNTELHEKRTNSTLFVVAKFTQITSSNSKSRKGQPLWTMDRMMTARQLFANYGINECDLPNGSRSKRNSFSSQITMHYQRLSSQKIVNVNDWNKIPILPNKKSFNPEDVDGVDLNEAIRHSMEQINDEQSELELIPMLTIKGRVYCDVLIPVQVNAKWFAVSYKTSTIRPYKATVTGLYVDAEDILCKASLVDANAVSAYDYILPPQEEAVSVPVTPLQRPSLTNYDSNDSVCSEIMETVNSQSIQLAQALERERMLIEMMLNQSNLGLKTSVASTSNSSFMSLPTVSPSPSMSFAPRTPSINQMNASRSAPMLPMLGSFVPSPMPTPPPHSLGNSFSLESSPSFIQDTNVCPDLHKVFNEIIKFRAN